MRAGTSLAAVPALEPLTPTSLEHFLDEQVTTTIELDVLVLFLSEPDQGWLSEAVAHRLLAPVEACQIALEKLRERGLLTLREPEMYWFAPVSPELALGAQRLWTAYRDSPVDVLRLLSQRALERIRRGARRTFLDSMQRPRSGK